MRRFTSIFVSKRDKKSDLSSSSSSSNSDHKSTPPWKAWIGVKRNPPPPLHNEDLESEEEEEEEEEVEEEEEQEQLENNQNNLRIHIQNSLILNPQLPNSPFVVHHPNQPIFPRSSNKILLSPQYSTQKFMFNSHLLARLNSSALSPSELSSVLPFTSKFTPSSITHPILPSSDISLPKNSSHISSSSLGIQRWITRPCFEDRFVVYLPTNSGIQCRPVTSSMPIAALEYPEHLDVMVNPDFDQSFPSPEGNVLNHAPPADPPQPYTTPSIQSHDFATESNPTLVTPVHWHNSSTAVPSPLRIQHSPPQPTKQEIPVAVVITPAPISSVKRVVRFAEDDEDDGIPLHMVRMKKKREEKAKFLRLEQLKRAKEEEDERNLQEQEALEKERRRLAKEKEKREMDKLLYAEAIVAARMRREGHRAGTIPPSYTTNSSNPLVSSPSYTSLKNSERNKPLTDSRKLSSKPLFDSPPTLSIPRRDNSDSASSPGSSRPSSIGHSPVSPGHHSRPPSTYSTHTSSSEDVRPQRGSKRNSVTAAAASSVSGGPSSYHRPPMVPSHPSWSGNSQSIPHVPSLPEFVFDMPLLPPTAPFMKGSSHTRSPGPSSTSSSRRGSLNSSNERLSPLPPQMTRTSSSSSTSRHHSSTAGPSSHSKPEKRPSHERKSSGDSRTLSLHSTQHQQRPIPTSSSSQPAVTRGRPPLPSSSRYLQTSGPWPALPQNRLTPMPMPMPMGYGPMNGYPVLLYPTGPMPTMQGAQSGSGGGGRMGGNNNGWRESLIS